MTTMNGADIFRTDTTLFVRIPRELAQDIDGGCSCDYCTAHPDETPKWDTLAIAVDPKAVRNDTGWTVHFPDFFSKAARDAHRRLDTQYRELTGKIGRRR